MPGLPLLAEHQEWKALEGQPLTPLPRFTNFATLQYTTPMWKDKLGNYLIDVSKYFLTGVFVASLVQDLEDYRWAIYLLSGIISAALLILGLILTNKKK